MAEFAPLFPLETQFQAKDGRNNTAGWLKVFLAGTDDPAVTYSDYSGTRNPEKIVLDNNGRAIIICDKEQGYRLEVYDARGMLLWTEEPVFCSGTGGAGMAMTEIVSTDGSIDVQKNTAGGVTQFDIGLAPNDSDEFLEWGKGFCSSMYSGSTKIPSYSAGTITFDEHGAKLYKDRFYHITNRFEVKPKGDGTQYETFMVAMKLYNPEDGTSEGVYSGQWNIDTSVSDVVILEFSFDLVPNYDGELYWDFANTLQLFQYTHAYMQIHRVYSGINAVPDTCATKQWISASYQPKSGMSSYVPYSAIGHDGDGAISGINGSAIAGQGVSPVTYVTTANTVYDVSNILASGGNPVFVDSLGVDKGLYVLVENWDRDNGFKTFGRIEHNGLYSYSTFWSVNVDGWENTSYVINDVQADWSAVAINSPAYIKNKPDLSQYQTTADMSGYLPNSASGSFYPYSGNPSGFLTSHQDISTKLDVTAFTSYSANLDSALGDEFDQIRSAFDNVQSALDDKLDKSASGDFYPMTGNPSGFITSVDLSPYQLTADMTAYARNSSLSSLIDYSALEYDGSGNISGISGSAIGGQGGTDSATVSAIASAYAESAASGKLDNSASSTWYPMTGNPSGFLTAHQDISDKLDSSSFTAYTSTALTGIQNDITSISASVSAVTGLTGTYLEQSSFTSYSADLDSALDSAFSDVHDELGNKADSSAMSAYIPFSSLDYSGSAISGIGGSSLAGIGQGGDYSGIYPVLVDNVNRTISVDNTGIAVDETMTAYESGGELVIGVASATLAGKLDTSAFTGYTATALTGLEQDVSSLSATVSGLTGTYLEQSASALFAPSSVETSKLDASASSQFITSTAGLQPSGDYAYNSALSGKLDESAFSSVSGTFLTAVPAGYATETYVDSAVSGKVDLSSDNAIQISAKGLTISGGTGITARYNNNMAVLQTYPTHRMYLSDIGASKRVDIYMSGISGNGDGTWQYGTSEYNKLTSVYDTVSGNSASWVGGGGIDSATCSAIASSYAESAASGKQDSSAMTAYQPAGTYIYESALGWAEV